MSSSTSIRTMSWLSRWSSTHWAETSELSRVIVVPSSLVLVSVAVASSRRCVSRLGRGRSNRLISRYISQPRQNRKTALSRAATRANPIATWPSRVSAGREAKERDERERRGRPPARTAAAPGPRARRVATSRGRTTVRNSHACGVCCTPRRRADREQHGLDAGQHRGPRAGQQQDDDQHHRGDAGGELRAARVDADGGLRWRRVRWWSWLSWSWGSGRQGPAHDDTRWISVAED